MKDRSIIEVIEKIEKQLPDEAQKELSAGLLSIRHSARFAAPEMMYLQWGKLGDLLEGCLGTEEPTEDWKKAIVEIMQGRA